MGPWLPLGLFAVLWIDMVRQLSPHWESSEQYAYGWFVPFLAAGLFVRRWFNRPEPALAPQNRTKSLPFLLLAALLAVIYLPVRMVHEINPDWPTCSWVFALDVVGLTFLAVYLMGGWTWARHFAFPVCFILIAVAWPYRIEHGLTQRLMRAVAALTVEVLGWVDIPAFQKGNLIEVSTGTVGIDEACSGIRSFQSTLMAALFLGEFYLLPVRRRLGLLFGGLVLSFCFNVVRTFILTWKASSEGVAAVEKWHDPAGLMIFFASFAGLYFLARLLRPKAVATPAQAAPTVSAGALSPLAAARGYFAVVGCWAVLVLLATEVWYRAHEVKTTGAFHWAPHFPTNSPGFAEMELNRRTKNLLRFDSSDTGRWKESDGTEWSAFFFRWNPKSVSSILFARQHRPEECLPAGGFRLVKDGGVELFEAHGLKIPFRKYTYESNAGKVNVFFCLWEDGSEKQSGMWGSMKSERVRAALVGRRNLGQQTLEIIVSGYGSMADAELALRNRLPELIQVNAPVAMTN